MHTQQSTYWSDNQCDWNGWMEPSESSAGYNNNNTYTHGQYTTWDPIKPFPATERHLLYQSVPQFTDCYSHSPNQTMVTLPETCSSVTPTHRPNGWGVTNGDCTWLSKGDSGCYLTDESFIPAERTDREEDVMLQTMVGQKQHQPDHRQWYEDQSPQQTTTHRQAEWKDPMSGDSLLSSPWNSQTNCRAVPQEHPTPTPHVVRSNRSGVRSIPSSQPITQTPPTRTPLPAHPPSRKQHQREQDKNRTRSLNVAFCRLRTCLPEIPKDTKLTKIRTLRYAISYIRHLIDAVEGDSSSGHSLESCGSFAVKEMIQLTPAEEQLMKDSGFDSLFEHYG